jgi:hypothetical protein
MVGAGAGLSFFINDYVSFDLMAGYSRVTLADKEDSRNKTDQKGIAVNIGFSFCL